MNPSLPEIFTIEQGHDVDSRVDTRESDGGELVVPQRVPGQHSHRHTGFEGTENYKVY